MGKGAGDEGHGSSPLVRGSVHEDDPYLLEARFIPARAGIGSCIATSHIPLSVHPRSCGDRRKICATSASVSGSSPLVRGSGICLPSLLARCRFIPVRAGIGLRRYNPSLVPPVHPRSCGDRGSRRLPLRDRGGSSPLVRGSDRPDRAEGNLQRFIPARAGIGDL